MESKIKWQTGFPIKKGRYIVSIKGGKIDMDNWSIYTKNGITTITTMFLLGVQ